MSKYLLLFLLVHVGCLGFGQNLISNPSFEQHSQCPDGENQVPYATGWMNFGCTPDYYHQCASNPALGVPLNTFGYQPANNGLAYAGLFIFWPGEVREYIGIHLSETLQEGQVYHVSFYTVASSMKTNSNHIGAKFTTGSFEWLTNNCDPSPLAMNEAVIDVDTILTDTLNWTYVQGTFVADSAYQFLVIGNFFSDALTDTIRADGVNGILATYYFIDDVCVANNENECLIDGLGDFKPSTQISLFPNPTSGASILYIQQQFPKNGSWQITDCMGRIVKKGLVESLGNQQFNFHQKDFTTGWYLVKVTVDESSSILPFIVSAY